MNGSIKDWQGFLLQLAVIGAVTLIAERHPELATMAIGILATMGGGVVQKARAQATGETMPPPSLSR